MLLLTLTFTLFSFGSITGLPTENTVLQRSSIPSWIVQIISRDASISTREKNDQIYLRLLNSARSIDQTNVTGAIGNFMPFVELGGRYYYFQTYFKASFFTSYQFCREHGMELVSIESKDENDHIINYLQENLTMIDHLWTSGNDLAQEGSFVWLSTGRRFTFTYWVPPNPDNSGKVEHCLHIWKLGPKNFVWNDANCKEAYHFACELR